MGGRDGLTPLSCQPRAPLIPRAVVNFVRRNFLGSMPEFRNQYVNPITVGQSKDATRNDVLIMKRRVVHLAEYVRSVGRSGGCF